jgi:hypothetical protein
MLYVIIQFILILILLSHDLAFKFYKIHKLFNMNRPLHKS